MLYVFSTSTFCFHWIRDSSLLNFCYIQFFFWSKDETKNIYNNCRNIDGFCEIYPSDILTVNLEVNSDWGCQKGWLVLSKGEKRAGRERGEGGGWEKHRSCAKNCSDKWNSDSLATCGWFRWLVEFLWPQSHGLYCSFGGNLSFWGCYWQRSSSHPPRLMVTLKMEMWNVFSCFAPEFLGSGILAFY